MLKKIDTKNGRSLYYNDGKMISLAKYTELLDQTVDQPSESTQTEVKSLRKCIFCGQTATRTKFVNLETIYLCDDDYINHTTGEIAAQLRTQNA